MTMSAEPRQTTQLELVCRAPLCPSNLRNISSARGLGPPPTNAFLATQVAAHSSFARLAAGCTRRLPDWGRQARRLLGQIAHVVKMGRSAAHTHTHDKNTRVEEDKAFQSSGTMRLSCLRGLAKLGPLRAAPSLFLMCARRSANEMLGC